MTNENNELGELITKKKAQIENHKRILSENGQSRWYDQSKRYLHSLEDELKILEEQLAE